LVKHGNFQLHPRRQTPATNQHVSQRSVRLLLKHRIIPKTIRVSHANSSVIAGSRVRTLVATTRQDAKEATEQYFLS